jgi:hypothetical protein
MPRISYFYGTAIYMYYNDHAPPHFHAIYGESEALFAIDDLGVIRGNVPGRVRSLVEWAAGYHSELVEDWDLARQGRPLKPIPPLD